MSNNRKKKVVEEVITSVPKIESGEHLMEVLILKKEKLDLQREIENIKKEILSYQITVENRDKQIYDMGKKLIEIKGKWWYKLFN